MVEHAEEMTKVRLLAQGEKMEKEGARSVVRVALNFMCFVPLFKTTDHNNAETLQFDKVAAIIDRF